MSRHLFKNKIPRCGEPIQQIQPVRPIQHQNLTNEPGLVRAIVRRIVQTLKFTERASRSQNQLLNLVIALSIVNNDLAFLDEIHTPVDISLFGDIHPRHEDVRLKVDNQLSQEIYVSFFEEEMGGDEFSV